MNRKFLSHVGEGLSADPKYLSSKYFYDKSGDQLFQKIMALDAYYLTKCEHEILSAYKVDILSKLYQNQTKFQLIEFGAGDGYKTKVLLEYFLDQGTNFKYLPVDISENALDALMRDLDDQFPNLNGHAINDDYFGALNDLKGVPIRKAVLFLGSNIGNFTFEDAARFLSKMRENLDIDDKLIIGFDLKKDPEIIKRAYNDEEGVTRAFNLNLLSRINRELDGNFNLDYFEHDPQYEEISGEARSYLRCLTDHEVKIGALETTFRFKKGERIFMEISKKYGLDDIQQLACASGFEVMNNYFDSKKYFVDSIWRRA